jgi:hypothetical protein
MEQLNSFISELEVLIKPLCQERGPISEIAKFDKFDCKPDLETAFASAYKSKIQDVYCRNSRRLAGKAFHRFRFGRAMDIKQVTAAEIFKKYDENGCGVLNSKELRRAIEIECGIRLTPTQIHQITNGGRALLNEEEFSRQIEKIFPRF